MKKHGIPQIERVTAGKPVTVDRHLTYRTDVVRLEGQASTFPYTHVVDNYVAAATVALRKRHSQREVLLIPQFRYPTDSFGWELPAGRPLEASENNGTDETQLDAAKREFREEAGYEAKFWKELPEVVENTGRGNSATQIFAAAGVVAVGNQLDATEAIGHAEWFSLVQVEDMLLDRQISAGHTIAGIAMANAFVSRHPGHPISQLVA